MTENRKTTPKEIETSILSKSARRCCLCFYLYGDLNVQHGQIAHLDQNRSNSNEENLAFLCLTHHSQYDSKTSQHKNFTISEVKAAKKELHDIIEKKEHYIGRNILEEKTQPLEHSEATKLLQETLNTTIELATIIKKARILSLNTTDTDFQRWLELELNGYDQVASKDLPHYRKIYGELQSFNSYRGWEPVGFSTAATRESFSFAPIGTPIESLEKSLRNRDTTKGYFTFNYTQEQKHKILSTIPYSEDVHLVLPSDSLEIIMDSVRNKIYEWLIRHQ